MTTGTQAQYWDELGVYSICLGYDVTRDFKSLKRIRQAVSCRLGLLFNDPCLYRCPYLFHHNINEAIKFDLEKIRKKLFLFKMLM